MPKCPDGPIFSWSKKLRTASNGPITTPKTCANGLEWAHFRQAETLLMPLDKPIAACERLYARSSCVPTVSTGKTLGTHQGAHIFFRGRPGDEGRDTVGAFRQKGPASGVPAGRLHLRVVAFPQGSLSGLTRPYVLRETGSGPHYFHLHPQVRAVSIS